MKNKIFNILIGVFITALLAVFFTPNQVLARSGCCSWHGGVSGCDTSVGRQVCNDGTYSPSCGCAYIPRKPAPPPPPPTPDFPKSITGEWKFINSRDGLDISFDWIDNSPTEYSIGVSSYSNSDPGPLADTKKTHWVFKNVGQGKKYINIKKSINGKWSRVGYWEVDVPKWIKPTPKPTHKPTNKPSSTPTPQVKGVSDSSSSIYKWLLFGSVSLIAYTLKKGSSL